MTEGRKARIGSLWQLRALVVEDCRRHRRDASSPGFQTLAVCRFGIWVDGLEHRWHGALRRSYRFLFVRMRRNCGVELGPDGGCGSTIRTAGRSIIMPRSAMTASSART